MPRAAQRPFVEAEHPRAPDGRFKHKPQSNRPDAAMPSSEGSSRYGHAVIRGGTADPRARIRGSAPLAPHPRILAWQPRLRRLLAADPRVETRLVETVTRLVGGMVEADSGGEPPRWNREWEAEALDLLREASRPRSPRQPRDDLDRVYEPHSPYAEEIWGLAYRESLDRASSALHSLGTARHAEDALLDAAQNAYSAYIGIPLRRLGSLDAPDARAKMSAFTHRIRYVLAAWLEHIDRNTDSEEAAEEMLLKHIDTPATLYARFVHTFDPEHQPASGEDGSARQRPTWTGPEAYEALRSRFYDANSTEPDAFAWDLFESLCLDPDELDQAHLDPEKQVDRLTRFLDREPRHTCPIDCADQRIMRVAKLFDAPSESPKPTAQLLNRRGKIEAALAIHSGGRPALRDSFVIWYDSQTEGGQQVIRILREEAR